MNSYYHDFSVGFNWYFVVGPALLILAAVIGWAIPRMKMDRKGRLRLKVYFNKRFGSHVVAPVFALIFGVMLFLESSTGIVQWFDNGLQRFESPVWSVLCAGAAVFAVTVAVGVLYYGVYCWGRSAKLNNLDDKYAWRAARYEEKLRRDLEVSRPDDGHDVYIRMADRPKGNVVNLDGCRRY